MRIALLVLAAALSWTTVGWAADLSGDEIKAMLIGKNFAFKTNDGKFSGRIIYAANGSVQMNGKLPLGLKSETGVWRVDGNRLCIKYKKIRGGDETCLTYEARPNGTFFSSSNTTLTLQK
jgi:hypothetical protein